MWNTKSRDNGPKYRKVVKSRHGCGQTMSLLKLPLQTLQTHLHMTKCGAQAEVKLHGRYHLALLYNSHYGSLKTSEYKSLTTATLVATDSTSHPRVIGGTSVSHASIPTGIDAISGEDLRWLSCHRCVSVGKLHVHKPLFGVDHVKSAYRRPSPN